MGVSIRDATGIAMVSAAMAAQSMRSPPVGEGSVFRSSAPRWITRAEPSGTINEISNPPANTPVVTVIVKSIEYHHLPELAPTTEILKTYRKDKNWADYVLSFEKLMDARQIPHSLDRSLFQDGPICLLCSEATPEQCHRRLVAELLASVWDEIDIRHLV